MEFVVLQNTNKGRLKVLYQEYENQTHTPLCSPEYTFIPVFPWTGFTCSTLVLFKTRY